MKVTYNTLEAFHAGVAAFVKEGLTFDADGDLLTITFTGGY